MQIEYKELFTDIDEGCLPNMRSLNKHGKEGWIFIKVTEGQVPGYCAGVGKALFYRQKNQGGK